ncbi:MAG TPA: hypothetical protein VMR62_19455 [Bryobacteraceae bacterium]|nr:hypothetical protein [Bryobacteraceae bacterium]
MGKYLGKHSEALGAGQACHGAADSLGGGVYLSELRISRGNIKIQFSGGGTVMRGFRQLSRFQICLQGRPVLVQGKLAVAQSEKKLHRKLRFARLSCVAVALLGKCGGVTEIAGAKFFVSLLVLRGELLSGNRLLLFCQGLRPGRRNEAL